MSKNKPLREHLTRSFSKQAVLSPIILLVAINLIAVLSFLKEYQEKSSLALSTIDAERSRLLSILIQGDRELLSMTVESLNNKLQAHGMLVNFLVKPREEALGTISVPLEFSDQILGYLVVSVDLLSLVSIGLLFAFLFVTGAFSAVVMFVLHSTRILTDS